MVTFVYATYFTQGMALDPTSGTILWPRGIALSAVVIALLSPFLGAAADRHGKQRAYLVRSSLLCIAATTNPAPPPSPAPSRQGTRFLQTLRDLQDFPEVRKFLLAHLLYNDGLVTIIAFGGIYAAGTFQMRFEKVLVFGIVLNLAAGIGSLVMGKVDEPAKNLAD